MKKKVSLFYVFNRDHQHFKYNHLKYNFLGAKIQFSGISLKWRPWLQLQLEVGFGAKNVNFPWQCELNRNFLMGVWVNSAQLASWMLLSSFSKSGKWWILLELYLGQLTQIRVPAVNTQDFFLKWKMIDYGAKKCTEKKSCNSCHMDIATEVSYCKTGNSSWTFIFFNALFLKKWNFQGFYHSHLTDV